MRKDVLETREWTLLYNKCVATKLNSSKKVAAEVSAVFNYFKDLINEVNMLPDNVEKISCEYHDIAFSDILIPKIFSPLIIPSSVKYVAGDNYCMELLPDSKPYVPSKLNRNFSLVEHQMKIDKWNSFYGKQDEKDEFISIAALRKRVNFHDVLNRIIYTDKGNEKVRSDGSIVVPFHIDDSLKVLNLFKSDYFNEFRDSLINNYINSIYEKK